MGNSIGHGLVVVVGSVVVAVVVVVVVVVDVAMGSFVTGALFIWCLDMSS